MRWSRKRASRKPPKSWKKGWWTSSKRSERGEDAAWGAAKAPRAESAVRTARLANPAGARVAIGLGGNLGDPLSWFRIATRTFALHLEDLVAAPLYRTEAISTIAQPPYLNTVLVGTALLPAVDLLAIAKALEHAAGRRPGPRHAPRPLDVDLLLYGDEVSVRPELRLPHPLLRERHFALQPLADLEPDRPLPPDGSTVREALAVLGPAGAVERLGDWLD